MAKTELLPCPFCGSDQVGWMIVTSNPRQKVVGCACGAEGPPRSKRADAIAAWNTRGSAFAVKPVLPLAEDNA